MSPLGLDIYNDYTHEKSGAFGELKYIQVMFIRLWFSYSKLLMKLIHCLYLYSMKANSYIMDQYICILFLIKSRDPRH